LARQFRIAAFNLDFLCIHPFRDGNCRVSRLFLLLQLYHLGFEVGRCISLERLIQANTEVLAKRVPVLSKLEAVPADTRWTPWQKDTIEPVTDHLRLPVVGLVDEVCASCCETVISV
jgi:Fic family protein